MTLDNIKNAINGTVILPTLGRQSTFTVINKNNVLTIINAANSRHTPTTEQVNRVYNRYQKLGSDRLQASQYTRPIWDGGNMIFDPYIAKIIDTFCQQVTANPVLEEGLENLD
jgi:hypothetical protein